MCGADLESTMSRMAWRGSPPRVRSRPCRTVRTAGSRGITSACAEQTAEWAWGTWLDKDHLRVCGADEPEPGTEICLGGSPPRVRSRLMSGLVENIGGGITSACAEQTVMTALPQLKSGDHLRVCGADRTAGIHRTWLWGSPPRVRSRPSSGSTDDSDSGITSACAEQTSLPMRSSSSR